MAKKQRTGCLVCEGDQKKNDLFGILICLVIFLLVLQSMIRSKDFAFALLFLIILVFCVIIFIRNHLKRS